MLIKTSTPIPYSEVTDRNLFENRRDFIKKAGLATAGASLLPGAVHASARRDDDPTPYEIVTGYNNFYEFGTGKEDPKRNAKNFKTDNWKVEVTGEVEESREWDLSEMIDGFETEQRIYRHRCVEGWSMVVPWNGFALKDLIEKLKPTAEAKYVEFTTLYDVRRMPGQSRAVLPWPYVEALRLDEAMHPLTMMVTGVYDEILPPQNGAPIRLIIPWKYGFKGGKSIVKIRFTKKQPRTTWNEAIPRE